jgi:small subunit ribosomal protein S21
VKLYGRTVSIPDGNWDRGLRKFKKKIAQSGILDDLRERAHYTKPTTRKKVKANAARARWLKYTKSQQLPPKQF